MLKKRLVRPVKSTLGDGRILTITPKRNAKSFIMRQNASGLSLTVPWGYPIEEITAKISELTTRWDSKCRHSTPKFAPGQTIECPGVTFELYVQSLRPKGIITSYDMPSVRIGIGSALNTENTQVQTLINTVLCKAAHHIAPQLLIPHARSIAQRVGATPAQWHIGRGHRILGTCSRAKVITLSHMCVFLSEELREYIVCHELAHLTHMNHSAQFHQLCDNYLRQREKSLERALRHYLWPIIR